jgi:hypothetical protein
LRKALGSREGGTPMARIEDEVLGRRIAQRAAIGATPGEAAA